MIGTVAALLFGSLFGALTGGGVTWEDHTVRNIMRVSVTIALMLFLLSTVNSAALYVNITRLPSDDAAFWYLSTYARWIHGPKVLLLSGMSAFFVSLTSVMYQLIGPNNCVATMVPLLLITFFVQMNVVGRQSFAVSQKCVEHAKEMTKVREASQRRGRGCATAPSPQQLPQPAGSRSTGSVAVAV